MTILVTGSNGQLGCALRCCQSLRRHNVFYTDIVELAAENRQALAFIGGADSDQTTHLLDVTKDADVRAFVRDNRVDVIINCAAYTNVDAAESNAQAARLLNAEVPAMLAKIAKENGALLVHISTDYVYGSSQTNRPYVEDTLCEPISVYGRTKLEGEQAVESIACRYVILRTAWLYSEFGHNFVRTMLRLTGEREQLGVVFDQVGTPTYAHDLAQAIVAIAEQGIAAGVYHYTNEGVCSWYDFTQAIARVAGNAKCHIIPLHTEEYPAVAPRPSFSVLDKTKMKKALGISIPYWTDSLTTCITNLQKLAQAAG